MGESENATFKYDTEEFGKKTVDFIKDFYPAYTVYPEDYTIAKGQTYGFLNEFNLYRLVDCTVDDIEDLYQYFAKKMQKLFTTAYATNSHVCYGIVSRANKTSLVIGIKNTEEFSETVIEGLLPGIKIEGPIEIKEITVSDRTNIGCISGIPVAKKDDKYIEKDISSLMRSLNGKDYILLVLSKPISDDNIQKKIDEAIRIRDYCLSFSKSTVSMQNGTSKTTTTGNMHQKSEGTQISSTNGISGSGTLPGGVLGAGIGSIFGPVGLIAGGLIGLLVGSQITASHSKTNGTSETITKGYSDSISKAISENNTISIEKQNGFALELMNMADNLIERLKKGRNIGMWESLITYSSDSSLAYNILKGSLYSEIASDSTDILPPLVFECTGKSNTESNDESKDDKSTGKSNDESKDDKSALRYLIPDDFLENSGNNLPQCSMVTSEELCGICTIPIDNTVGFEIKKSNSYSINNQSSDNDIVLGKVCEYERVLPNAEFGLSKDDLNKHTFVCGITGSGKTNTVKHILSSVYKKEKIPFLVIEPVKKEYRNLKLDNDKVAIYTLGRPELNSIRINPFYIMPGVSPQQHIDALKDLFSASFAFYGPMPYIMEKCLHKVYEKKGWNLTLGFHKKLIDKENIKSMFDREKIKNKYEIDSHKYIFPTMQDLKEEVDYYVNYKLDYDVELKGNIRSAINARIDSLCVGSKGYMFNTNEYINFDDLLKKPTVLELEGLADDSDKAFALGLIMIYISEYRQNNTTVSDLKHLFVIEEAHRLLKNVSTERNEDIGNPKGKAVEHFTNILAEMRSYGQGVIVAEQIPSKLAVDVIKNSSNKIIHRLVASDDQELVANTVGLEQEKSICIGNQKTGYALCYKEGMTEPVTVKVNKTDSNEILDADLLKSEYEDKLFSINKSIIFNTLNKEVSKCAVRMLIDLMYFHDEDRLCNGMKKAVQSIKYKLGYEGTALIHSVQEKYNEDTCISDCIVDAAASMLVSGMFSSEECISNDIINLLRETVNNPYSYFNNETHNIDELISKLDKHYGKNPKERSKEIVANLLVDKYLKGDDITEAVNDYLSSPDNNEFVNAVKKYTEERKQALKE